MDVSFVSENPRPDGWPGNQQPDQEGDEATLGCKKVGKCLSKQVSDKVEIRIGTVRFQAGCRKR